MEGSAASAGAAAATKNRAVVVRSFFMPLSRCGQHERDAEIVVSRSWPAARLVWMTDLFSPHRDAVVRSLERRFGRELAEDAVQDALAQALVSREEPANPKAWLH